jgi:hypothetical protein
MPRVFFGNFDFEHELTNAADRSHAPVSGHTLKSGETIGADLAWAWTAIAKADDVILTPGEIQSADFSELRQLGLPIPGFVDVTKAFDETAPAQFVPWGWTASLLAFGESRGWECAAPPIQVVREVNRRAFRFSLEEQWGIGLPGAAIATSPAELDDILRQSGDWSRGWLLKANFGMSGREALRGRGTQLDDPARNWALRQLQSAGPIVVEPIVDRIAEAGLQLEISRAGEPELIGITPLLVDRAGVYRGSRFGSPSSELEPWQPAIEPALRVARELQRLGYFGPLGIDAMRYRDRAGEIRLRPLQDLNARYTMGRLALGFRRILPVGWCGSWLHFGTKQLRDREVGMWLAEATTRYASDSRIAVASARTIGSQFAQRHAVLVLSPTAETRNDIERALFASLGIDVGEL